MRHASGLGPPRRETPVASGLRAVLLVAGSLVLAGCASLSASVDAAPATVEARAPTRVSATEVGAPQDTRPWAALSKAGREAQRVRNYREAESSFLAALALTDSLPSYDVRIRTSLGNLVALAARCHQQGRDEDARRLMNVVAEHVESRGLAPHIEVPYADRYQALIEPRPRRTYARRRGSRLRRFRTPVDHTFDEMIARTARSYRVDPALVKAVVAAESNFEVTAVSRAGAQGLMQLMPETARAMDVLAPFQPSENLRGGVRYLRQMLDRYDDLRLALAAYNAGPEAVDRHAGIPPYPETRAYVARVVAYFRSYQGEFMN
jgi:soluble lytic murein transglycosylase